MTEIHFTSEITVEEVQQMGTDLMIARAAMVSTGRDLGEITPMKVSGLINYLIKSRHGTPFECGALTVRVHAPIKVFREWHRHRIGFCLTGDTEVWTETKAPNSGRTLRKRPISELWRNWHEGVPDSLGRIRLLPSCRNLPCRVANESTGAFELGRMTDIVQSGVKEIVGLRVARGFRLKCSRDHQVLTRDGWARAGDLQQGDCLAVSGRIPVPGDRVCPPQLRRGIGVWTSMQRKRMIKPIDSCAGCGTFFPADKLVLDHEVPVAANLMRALDLTNLRPYCLSCHREKTNSEQVLGSGRGGVAGVIYSPLTESPTALGEEMTYDIAMEGPWHNFVANGIVVHNSYNETSGRYKDLEPVFYIPPPERPAIRPDDFKSARPAFDRATIEEYDEMVYILQEGYKDAYAAYMALLKLKVDRGLARDVLGVGIYSSMYCTANPRSLMAFLELRTDHPEARRPSKPLWEIDVAAQKLEAIFQKYWPVTHAAWVEHGRMAP